MERAKRSPTREERKFKQKELEMAKTVSHTRASVNCKKNMLEREEGSEESDGKGGAGPKSEPGKQTTKNHSAQFQTMEYLLNTLCLGI